MNLGESTINCSNILKKHMIDNRNRLFKSEKEFIVTSKFAESISFTHKDGIQIQYGAHFWVPVPHYSNGVIEVDTEALQNFTYGIDKLTVKERSFIVNCPSIDKFKTICTVVACMRNLYVPYTLSFQNRKKNCKCSSYGLFRREWVTHLHVSVKQAR